MVCRHLSAAVILTGPTFSGKTRCLARWAEGRTDIAGLLSPDKPGGRIFVDLATGDTVAMESANDAEPAISVGRFRFRAAAFDWANERLRIAAADPSRPTIVIDEIGPLELSGEGLVPGLRAALARDGGATILVVREGLVDRVREAFALPQPRVLTTASWPQSGQIDTSAP